ncbi:MAG TPA: T9SS type A sorting domain-containing protein, partial [Paludibacteraceae bacterium]|nr:T9SS type A sorting domain-containing protein [Paludibacteraceae bacterium]
TGLNKTELKNIAVYPNPAKDVINVDWNKNETPTITVYALSGVKITSTKATNINVSNLSEGIYMLKVEGKDKTFTTPVAVVK